jgi:hypothetical protein
MTMRALAITLLITATLQAQSLTTLGVSGGSASFTLSHHSHAACTTGTTCAVTLSGSVVTGDLLLMSVSMITAGSSVQGIDVGGTWQSGYNLTGGSTRYMTVGYVYPATATAGPITVAYTATNGGTAVDIYDYTVTGGTPSLDAVNSFFENSGSSPFNGPAITLTGSKDVVLVGAMGDSTHPVTAVGAPWGDTNFAASQTRAGSADQVNVTSVTVPSWTAASTAKHTGAAIAFGFGAKACTNAGMMDWSGGTAGNNAAVADLTTSTLGMPNMGNIGAANSPFWSVTHQISMAYSVDAHVPLLNPASRFCTGGATYSDSGGLGIDMPTVLGQTQYLIYTLAGSNNPSTYTPTSVAACGQILTTLPIASSGSYLGDMFAFAPSDSTNFINIHISSNTTNMAFAFEDHLGGGRNRTPIITDTSVTSNDVGTGSKTWAASTGIAFSKGQRVRIWQTSNEANYDEGAVTGYDTGTGSLTLLIDKVGGSGTGVTDWTIRPWYIVCSRMNQSFGQTSTTSLDIGTGTKTLTLAGTAPYKPSQIVRVFQTSASTNYMDGTVTSYDSAGPTLVVNATSTGGSGTGITDWTVGSTVEGAIYDSLGTLVGSKLTDINVGTNPTSGAKVFEIGNLNGTTQPTGHHIYFGHIKICAANGGAQCAFADMP